jgi:transposase-like protein
MPYSPEKKARILSKARKLMGKGESRTEVAQAIGVHPQTLKRWLQERQDGLQTVRDANNKGIELRNATMFIGEPQDTEANLSRRQVQELCEEYWKLVELNITDDGGVAAALANKVREYRDERMTEIQRDVGVDAIAEYHDKRLMKRKIGRMQKEMAAMQRDTRRNFLLTWITLGIVSTTVGLLALSSLLA